MFFLVTIATDTSFLHLKYEGIESAHVGNYRQ